MKYFFREKKQSCISLAKKIGSRQARWTTNKNSASKLQREMAAGTESCNTRGVEESMLAKGHVKSCVGLLLRAQLLGIENPCCICVRGCDYCVSVLLPSTLGFVQSLGQSRNVCGLKTSIQEDIEPA